jgi:hypothetical protein
MFAKNNKLRQKERKERMEGVQERGRKKGGGREGGNHIHSGLFISEGKLSLLAKPPVSGVSVE